MFSSSLSLSSDTDLCSHLSPTSLNTHFIEIKRQCKNTHALLFICIVYTSLLLFLHQGAVITPAMDHTMSMQPASMMGPITQQMNHLSLGTTGSVSTRSNTLVRCTQNTRLLKKKKLNLVNLFIVDLERVCDTEKSCYLTSTEPFSSAVLVN